MIDQFYSDDPALRVFLFGTKWMIRGSEGERARQELLS
jgi:hypothetical protein